MKKKFLINFQESKKKDAIQKKVYQKPKIKRVVYKKKKLPVAIAQSCALCV